MKFNILNTGTEVELISYIKEYFEKHPETEILIGSDSQSRKRTTYYAVVIGLYRKGKGAHVLYQKKEIIREKDNNKRLLNEVWMSVELAELIKKELNIKAKYIDIDINEDKKYKSNVMLSSAIGLAVGMGYEVRFKNKSIVRESPMMCYSADKLVK